MKKVVSIFLAFLILYNILGYVIIFKSYQYAIKKEVKRKIKNAVPENELLVIRLTESDMRCRRNGYKKVNENEFKLSGKLYDIVRCETVGDTTIVYCINDTKEEQLFANLDAHIKRHIDSNSPTREKSLKMLKNLVKQALLYKYILAKPDGTDIAFSKTDFTLPKFFNKNIPNPPPEKLL